MNEKGESTITTMLPGAVSLTHIRVYPQGGTPHVHMACSEAYIPLSGSGSVQLLRASGFEEVPLVPGNIVWFEPGVLHRLVNSKDLELLVLVENSGLVEAGDTVFSFPDAVLLDSTAYGQAAAEPVLPTAELDDLVRVEAAVSTRRQLALSGFLALKDALEQDLELGQARLSSFYQAATRLIQPHLQEWHELVQMGSVQQTHQTQLRLEHLQRNAPDLLCAGRRGALAFAEPRLEMCGIIRPSMANPLLEEGISLEASLSSFR